MNEPGGSKGVGLLSRSCRLDGRNSVRDYVRAHHWEAADGAIVLYVSDTLELLVAKAEAEAGGGTSDISRNLLEVVRRGRAICAAGFIVAQVHSQEHYYPDPATAAATKKLRRDAAELDFPLLDHLVFTDTQTISIGGP